MHVPHVVTVGEVETHHRVAMPGKALGHRRPDPAPVPRNQHSHGQNRSMLELVGPAELSSEHTKIKKMTPPTTALMI